MALFSIVTLGLVFYAPLLILWKLRASSKSSLNNIPGPKATSWLKGHMGQLLNRDAHRFRKELSEQYGRVVRILGLFSRPQLLVFDPIALHSILIKEHHIFEEPATHLVGNLIAFGPGLASVTGDQHKKQRKMLNPAFSIAHLRETLPMMYDVSYRLRDAVSARLNGDDWTEIDMMGWISRTALELVAQAGLGSSLDSLEADTASPYGDALKSFIPALVPIALLRRVLPYLVKIGSPAFRRRIVDIIPSASLQRVKGIIDVLDSNARRIVSEKLDAVRRGDEAGDGKDILSRLVRANVDASGDETMSEEEIIGQVSILVFAATDTTSSAVSRILYLLAQHQDVQDKLRQEIVQARSESGDLSFDALFELPYLEAVCRETLRLYAPVSFVTKTARQDTVVPLGSPIHGVDGHEIERLHVPKGTTIFVGIAAANRTKEIWGEDADEWKPERWLSPLPETLLQARMPGVYSHMMTFLGGGRACIGFKFSQCEMKAVLSILLESFAFELSDTPLRWNTASVQYPSTMTSDKAQLPIKVKKLVQSGSR